LLILGRTMIDGPCDRSPDQLRAVTNQKVPGEWLLSH
jgi:hypothetical protein